MHIHLALLKIGEKKASVFDLEPNTQHHASPAMLHCAQQGIHHQRGRTPRKGERKKTTTNTRVQAVLQMTPHVFMGASQGRPQAPACTLN